MTFIASVVAKDGVAIIADSLVTTMVPILEWNDFIEYIKQQPPERSKEDVLNGLSSLFNEKPSYTKDYENKLYRYDKFTGIAFAGSAVINNKRIEKLVHDAIKKLRHGPKSKKSFKTKVEELRQYFEIEVRAHIEAFESISRTTFIVTHFIPSSKKTVIYKIDVSEATKVGLANHADTPLVAKTEIDSFHAVVCEGQNRIAEKILYGDLFLIFGITPKIVRTVGDDFKIPEHNITDDYIKTIIDSNITPQTRRDIKIGRLSQLSLQQAVDLACLLMKIEIDIQKYTENIPTVGGNIKTAIINEHGFSYIDGDKIKLSVTF